MAQADLELLILLTSVFSRAGITGIHPDMVPRWGLSSGLCVRECTKQARHQLNCIPSPELTRSYSTFLETQLRHQHVAVFPSHPGHKGVIWAFKSPGKAYLSLLPFDKECLGLGQFLPSLTIHVWTKGRLQEKLDLQMSLRLLSLRSIPYCGAMGNWTQSVTPSLREYIAKPR